MPHQRHDPQETILALREERFADAEVLFLAGSVMRGEGTPFSDLDVVVLYSHLDRAYRQSIRYRDWPVELFVHDYQTLAYFFEQDRLRGIPSLASMVAEGVELPSSTLLSRQAKDLAQQSLQAGPGPFEPGPARYVITDLCDDLRAPRHPDQATAAACRLYHELANFLLRSKGEWSAQGKSIPARLGPWRESFEQAFSSRQTGPLIALCEKVLEPAGGFLFEGPPLLAPAEWRQRPLPSLQTQRLELRLAQAHDVPTIVSYCLANRVYLQPYEPERQPDYYTQPYWQAAVARALQEWQQGSALRLWLFDRESGLPIGVINFSQIFRGAFQACYLGFALDQSQQGRGLMAEALQSAIPYAATQLQLHRMMANYLPDNQRSGSLLSKLGFEVEGLARNYLQINGQWRDHVLSARTFG